MAAAVSHLYPPSPATVPPDLTRPSESYRSRVIIVLASLIVFVIIYLGLTIGSAYTCYYCIAWLAEDEPKPQAVSAAPAYPQTGGYRGSRTTTQPVRDNRTTTKKPIFGLVIGAIFSGLFCLFLVKGLFKSRRVDPGVRIEVTEAEHPQLYAFIRQLCRETGAPFPHRVFLTPDVNAAVSFDESILNLLFPSKKNLIIGLGLVNRLNLSEFKAVLAHEFGHFSQNSMKLGSYVYTSNRIVADLVYGRDWLDDLLLAAQRTDIRIAVFAWVFGAGLWTMRKGLDLLFRGINFAHASLSRQMEYNADLVAVSVAGSDAGVFALARLDLASDSLGQAWTDLTAAADHGRFSRDIYYHQTRAAEFLRARRGDPNLGTVPDLPDDPTRTVQVFKPEDTSVPKMWATHPSNHDREVNAKARYIRSPIDERSPWLLFENSGAVREAITRRIYEVARKVKPEKLEDPEAVQAFIDAEHAETTYHPRYHGLYENRYVKPGDLAELGTASARADLQTPEALAEAHARLTGDELKTRMDAHKSRSEEAGKLARMAQGAVELRGKDFEHRGNRYRLADAARLLKEVESELDKDFEWMYALDRDVFRVHHAMAAELGDNDRSELESRYRFHLAAQDIHAFLNGHMRHIQNTLAALAGQRQVEQWQFQQALGALRGAHDALREQLDVARGLYLPALTNMSAGDSLGPFLLSEPLVANLSAGTQTLDGAWIGRLMNQMGEVLDKLARILFKSLGGILAVQENLADRWLAARQATDATPAETPAPSPPGAVNVTSESA
jgi:Zn-dependent protease with chaperone function